MSVCLTTKFVFVFDALFGSKKSKKRLFGANRDQIGTNFCKMVSIETFCLKRDHSTSSVLDSYLQDVLPSKAKWLKDSVTSFDPSSSKLVTANGDSVSYDWLVIATGLQLR